MERTQADIQIIEFKVTESMDELVCTVTITNDFDDTARNAKLIVLLPVEVSFLSNRSSPGGQPDGIGSWTSCVSYELGNMDVRQVETRSIITTLPRLEDTPRKFGAFVYSQTPDPNPGNNFRYT